MKTKIVITTLIACVHLLQAQSHTEKLTREFIFDKVTDANTFIIANINGSVRVAGYDGDKVQVEVEKSIQAKTESRLESGKKDLSLGIIDRADTIILYVEGLCNKFGRNNGRSFGRKNTGGWGYDWNNCNDEQHWRKDEGYDYKFDFVIRVPADVNVVVSTINNGDVEVQNTRSMVVANNVNGAIRLKNITGATFANTVNGDVDLDYTRNPDKDCRYYTLNGNINANFKQGLSAELSFESFNGSFYTNVTSIESLPVALEKKPKDEGVKYKLSGNRFKVGSGGIHLDFETFNGNVYLREN